MRHGVASLKTIAAACSVNPTTASLALNNHPRVAPATRERIQETARRLGYAPNHAARQLARARFGRHSRAMERVGLVMFDRGGAALRSIYMAFLVGVERRIAELGGILVFLRATPSEPGARLEGVIRSRVADGLLLFGAVDDAILKIVRGLECPFVVLGDRQGSAPAHQATVDYRAMGGLAVRHLVKLGHRRIGFLGATMRFVYQREIRDGVRSALADAGLPVSDELFQTREGCPDFDFTEPVRNLLALASRPTAVILGETGRTADVLALLSRQGVRVPDDLVLAACETSDSIPAVPGVPGLDVSAAAVGSAAVDLLREVAGDPAGPPRQVLVKPHWTAG